MKFLQSLVGFYSLLLFKILSDDLAEAASFSSSIAKGKAILFPSFSRTKESPATFDGASYISEGSLVDDAERPPQVPRKKSMISRSLTALTKAIKNANLRQGSLQRMTTGEIDALIKEKKRQKEAAEKEKKDQEVWRDETRMWRCRRYCEDRYGYFEDERTLNSYAIAEGELIKKRIPPFSQACLCKLSKELTESIKFWGLNPKDYQEWSRKLKTEKVFNLLVEKDVALIGTGDMLSLVAKSFVNNGVVFDEAMKEEERKRMARAYQKTKRDTSKGAKEEERSPGRSPRKSPEGSPRKTPGSTPPLRPMGRHSTLVNGPHFGDDSDDGIFVQR